MKDKAQEHNTTIPLCKTLTYFQDMNENGSQNYTFPINSIIVKTVIFQYAIEDVIILKKFRIAWFTYAAIISG